MKGKFAVLFLCLLYQVGNAQDWYNDPQSYNGVVILDDRSTTRGVFSYNQSNEKLVFDNGKEVNANDALYFQYYDANEKYNRYYFSFISSDGRYRFYEVLLNGKIPLYRKSVLTEKDYIDNYNNNTTIFIDKKVVETKLYMVLPRI